MISTLGLLGLVLLCCNEGYAYIFHSKSAVTFSGHFKRFRMSNNDPLFDKKLQVADPTKPIEGYLNTDLNKMDDSKMGRVVAYILIALLPCLLLVPLVLNKSFVPANF